MSKGIPTNQPLRLASMLSSLAAASALPAAVATPWGQITPSLELSSSYDTRVRANGLSNQASWIHSVTPAVFFERAEGLLVLEAEAGVAWRTYTDAEDLDGTDPFAEAGIAYRGGLYRARARAFGNESAVEDTLRATRSRQRSYGVDGQVTRLVKGKWGLGVDGTWSRLEEEETGREQQRYSAGPRVTYRFNDSLDFFAGYRLETVKTEPASLSGNEDTDFSGFEVGMDGIVPLQLFPGLTLNATAGWKARSGEGVTTSGGLVGTAELEYALSPLTDLRLIGNRSLVTSLDSDQGTSSEVRLELEHRFHKRFTATASGGWTQIDLEEGPLGADKQDTLSARLEMNYQWVRFVELRGDIEITDASADSSLRSFSRERYTLSARISY